MSVAGVIRRTLQRALPVRRPRRAASAARCASETVGSPGEIRSIARRLEHAGGAAALISSGHIEELTELNTPALYLNVVERSRAVRVLLRPWDGRGIRFRGTGYFVEARSEAPEGIEAFAPGPLAHVTALYPTVPDHPVHVITIENQGVPDISGVFPSYLTHVTIAVNGRIVTRAERLWHERAVRIWTA